MRSILLFLFLSTPVIAFSQDLTDTTYADDFSQPPVSMKEGFFVNLTFENLRGLPDKVAIKDLRSRGAEIGYIHALHIIRERFLFGIGLQLSFQNIHSNLFSWELDTVTGELFNYIPETVKYEKNKLGNTYLELPLELRFKTAADRHDKSVNLFAGFKTGFVLSSYTKFKDEESKYRFLTDNVEDFRYGLTGRIGYGNLCLYGYYGLSDLFKKGEGVPTQPVSIGLTVFF